MCVAVHVMTSDGANAEPFAGVHNKPLTSGSATVTAANVTLPVFDAVIV